VGKQLNLEDEEMDNNLADKEDNAGKEEEDEDRQPDEFDRVDDAQSDNQSIVVRLVGSINNFRGLPRTRMSNSRRS
jgi:hypothetical protein